MVNLTNQVALITGASSGIGASLAQELVDKGAKVSLLARRSDRLEKIAHQIDPSGEKVLPITCDVNQAQDLEKAVNLTQEKFGSIDIVVANAGWSLKGHLEELCLEDYQRLWNTNILGVLRTIYATLNDLKKTKGKLVIISSVKSYIALKGDSPYSMSKFALRALCESLSQELKPYGVSVIHICPGYVNTEIRQIDNQGEFHADWQDPVSPFLLMSSEKAAKEIVKAIERRQPEQILTYYGKLIVFLKRHFPSLINWLITIADIKVSARHKNIQSKND